MKLVLYFISITNFSARYDTDYTQITNSAFHDNYAGTTGGVIYM
jgi:hypothetical protein